MPFSHMSRFFTTHSTVTRCVVVSALALAVMPSARAQYLEVQAGETLIVDSDILSPIRVAGTVLVAPGSDVNLSNSLEMLPGGRVDLEDGYIEIFADEKLELNGGELTSGNVTFRGVGAQTEGSASVGVVRFDIGSPEFELSGGTFNTVSTEMDRGIFRQTGGLHDAQFNLLLDTSGENQQGYFMEGGSLRTLVFRVGGRRRGTPFHQTGGDIEAAQLSVRNYSNYTLDDGKLTVATVFLSSVGAFYEGESAGIQINGGILEVGGDRRLSDPGLRIGSGSEGGGLLQITGGEIQSASAPLYVGHSRWGSLVMSGGLIQAQDAYVGWQEYGQVEQSGGTLKTHSPMYVGYGEGSEGLYKLMGGVLQVPSLHLGVAGVGTVVQDGGRAEINSALRIGADPNTTARAIYTLNNGSITTTAVSIGRETGPPQYATLNQTGGINQTQSLQVNSTGRYILSGGTLDLGGNQLTVHPGGQFNFNGGTLTGVTAIDFEDGFVQYGGTLAPGSSPGLLQIDGGYTLEEGTLEIELYSDILPGIFYDQLQVQGEIALMGTNGSADAELRVILNYPADIGDQFIILENDGTEPIAGTFAQGSIVTAEYRDLIYSFEIDYEGNSGNDIVLTVNNIVPEPGCAALFLSVAAMLTRRRRDSAGGSALVF